MTQATQTTFGEIKLAGDLSGTAEAPELKPSGVTAGTFVFPTVTVNSKGLITNAHSGSTEDIRNLIPGATRTSKGIVQVGDNIEVTTTTTQGYTLIGFGGLVVGTDDSGLDYDPCRPYTVTLNYTLENGTGTSKNISIVTDVGGFTFNQLISAVNIAAGWDVMSIVSGDIRLIPKNTGAGSYISLSNDCLFKYLTGYTGTVTGNFGNDKSVIWVKEASVSDFGVIKVGSGLSMSGGILSVDMSAAQKATVDSYGVVKIGSGIAVTDGVVSTDSAYINSHLPVASTTVSGAFKVGSGLNMSAGVLNVNDYPIASSSEYGTVKVDDVTVKSTNGVLTVPLATNSTAGIVKPGATMEVDGSGTLSASGTYATNSTAGIVKVGSGLTVENGVIGFDASSLPLASPTVHGVVKIGDGVSVTDGVASVALGDATSSNKGIASVAAGGGLSVTNGVISYDSSQLPKATANDLGTVKVGAGLTVDAGGTVAVNNADLPLATTTTRGTVIIGSGIAVNNGSISLAWATTSSKGIIQVGNGLAIGAGAVLSVDTNTNWATTTNRGYVKIGTGINVNAGVISLAPATATTLGAVKTGTGITNSGGSISIPAATPTTAGIVKIGTGLTTDVNGALTITSNYASSTTAGIVKIGNGLTVTNGVVSFDNLDSNTWATDTKYGLVKVQSSTTGLKLTDGVLSFDDTKYAKLNQTNTFTVPQTFTSQNIVPVSNIAYSIDPYSYVNFRFDPTSNFQIAINASGTLEFGARFNITVVQGATGRTVIFDDTTSSKLKISSSISAIAGTTITAGNVISAVANSTTTISCMWLDSNNIAILERFVY